MTERKALFSVTASDCDWSFTKGTGKGGQKKNKTASAVHCSHKPSGAHAFAQDTRSQHDNKILAFTRMYNTKEFQKWIRQEFMRRSGQMAEIERRVEYEMKSIKIEVKKDDIWIEVKKDDPLDEPVPEENQQSRRSEDSQDQFKNSFGGTT